MCYIPKDSNHEEYAEIEEKKPSTLENLSNDELLEKTELIYSDLVGLMKELYSRIGRRDISSNELERFQDISEKAGIALIDMAPPGLEQKAVENTIKTSISGVVKKAYNPDR